MSNYQKHPAEDGYEFDFGGYLTEGLELYKKNIGLFIGATLVYLLLITISSLTLIGAFLLSGPLTGGLYKLIQNVDKGRPAQIGDLFSDFENFSNHLVGTLVVILMVLVGTILFLVPGFYLGIALSMFIPCITLLGQDWQSAITTSRKVIHKNWWWWFLFFIVNGILASIGVIAFGIGVIFTMPLQYIFNYVAFKRIFMVNATNEVDDGDSDILDSGFLSDSE